MYGQLGYMGFIAGIQKKIQEKTGLLCYDTAPENALAPYYMAKIINKRPAHSKTMYMDVLTVWIHVIAEPLASLSSVYEQLQGLEEALTEDIALPDGFEVIVQSNTGIEMIKTEEKEKEHIALVYEFIVCHGLKCCN